MEERKRQMDKQLDIPVQVKWWERKLVACLKPNKKRRSKNSSSGVAPCSIVFSFSRCEDVDLAALIRLLFTSFTSHPNH